MQDSFIFYRSFSDAIKVLSDEEQLKAFWAIVNYSLEEQEQEVDGMVKVVYILAKPQIAANLKRRADGMKGGRPPTKTTGFADIQTTGFENKKPNVNGNVNKNNNENDNDNVYVSVNDNDNVKENDETADADEPSPTVTLTAHKPKKYLTDVEINARRDELLNAFRNIN